jgi:glycosyltransferase involved in cell wall biosynthesis
VKTRAPLVLVANARMPSQRAQSLQVAQCAAAYQRAGASTTLLHAARHRTTPLPPDVSLLGFYGITDEAPPGVEAVRCVDWIDRVPRALQYAPARLQEQSFARNAARRVLAGFDGARVLSREVETAVLLVRKKRPDVFLEIHRVPGGKLRRRWLLEAARGVRGIVAISGGVRDGLARLGIRPDLVRVEHDGFDAARFAGVPSRREARAELSLPVAAFVVVYPGGLLAWKGADVLVEAARELPDVYFVVAGGMDRDVARLRSRAGGLANVRIDGFQPPARVPLYLAAADLGAVPNRSKPAISSRFTSPLKVFEAMGAGLPLVASDLPSLRELLENERDAVLVTPDDPGALARAIARLAGDATLRERLAANLRGRAARHTWDARAERILDWMEAS